MVNRFTLKNPPIKEALIDLRVTYDNELTVERLDEIYELLKEYLPNKRVQQSVTFSWSSNGTKTSNEESVPSGFILRDKKDEQVFQINKDGITLSLINNYSDWGSFEKLFWKYVNIANKNKIITSVNRVGVRYINKIQIPNEPSTNLNDYFEITPNFKSVTKKNPSEFLLRAAIPNDDGFNCILTQGKNPKDETANSIGIILDIDIFKVEDFTIDKPDHLKSLFSKIRKVKNDVFFNSLSKKTKDLLNG